MKIINMAPNPVLRLEDDSGYVVTITREADGEVYVEIVDTEEGSETRVVLGRPGETQKL